MSAMLILTLFQKTLYFTVFMKRRRISRGTCACEDAGLRKKHLPVFSPFHPVAASAWQRRDAAGEEKHVCNIYICMYVHTPSPPS